MLHETAATVQTHVAANTTHIFSLSELKREVATLHGNIEQAQSPSDGVGVPVRHGFSLWEAQVNYTAIGVAPLSTWSKHLDLPKTS